MIFAKTLLFLSINFWMLYLAGINFVKLCKIKNLTYSIFFSIALVSVIISYLYFRLNFEFYNIQKIIFVILVFLSVFAIKFINEIILKEIISDFLIFLPIVILFSSLIHIYGLQYYIFRGNYYDVINYTSMSLAFISHPYNELNEIFNNQNFSPDQIYLTKSGILNEHRVIAPLFFSLSYLPKIFDIFHANTINKIFFLGLSSLGIKMLFQELKIIKKKKNILIFSTLFPFCFWQIYIFEIDAYAQLMALPFSLISLTVIYLITKKFLMLNYRELIFYLFLIFSFFCIYPEQASLYFLFGLILFLINYYYHFNNLKFCLKILVSILFGLIVILLHENILGFLKFQVSNFTFINFNWWGYYGAFILGSENIVLNENFVFELKEYLKNNDINIFSTLIKIHKSLILENYLFYILNIIPSIFGMYYLTIGKITSILDYSKVILLVTLNFVIIRIFVTNLLSIFKNSKIPETNFIKLFFLFFLFFSLIFIIKNALWQFLKLYMYFSILFFLILAINFSKNFKNNKIHKLILILLVIFPIYKFSKFNSGITRIDTFPSIINKDMKTNIDWELKKKNITSCDYNKLNNKMSKNQSLDYFYSIIRSYEKLKNTKIKNPCNKN